MLQVLLHCLAHLATLTTLLDFGTVPVINENDSVATDEIRFGDNDTLAAMVTNLLQADLLIVLTDIEGLYRADPRQHAARVQLGVTHGSVGLHAEAREQGEAAVVGDPSLDDART